MDIIVSATGNHQCLVFRDVIEFTSHPIEPNYAILRPIIARFRNTVTLFIAANKISKWARFMYKTAYLNNAVFVFDIDGVARRVDGKNIDNNLHTSAENGNGYIVELIFNEENMEVC